MMSIKLPSDFAVSTRKKLTETSSGKFFKQNNPKLLPSFDRGVFSDDGLVVGNGEVTLHSLPIYIVHLSLRVV
jgi:hypothetical protein